MLESTDTLKENPKAAEEAEGEEEEEEEEEVVVDDFAFFFFFFGWSGLFSLALAGRGLGEWAFGEGDVL